MKALEAVTSERDRLKSDQERSNAMWESRVKRLERRIEMQNSGNAKASDDSFYWKFEDVVPVLGASP